MKTIIAALALVATTLSANAGYGKTKTVKSESKLAMATGLVPYSQLCLNGDKLQTVNPKEVCVAYKSVKKGDDRVNVCVETEMQILSRNLDYVKTVCLEKRNNKDRCLREGKVDATLATSYTVSVNMYKWYGSNQEGDYRFFKNISKETVEVPACN